MNTCYSAPIPGVTDHDKATCKDLELVEAARLGSNDAFEELQSRHSRRLYRRIRAITRNHEDTEDALQDTFLRAFLAIESFEGRSQFATWLTRIAINSALMLLRRRVSRPEVSLDASPESDEPALTIDVRDTALNPEELYDLRQRSRCISRAIDELNINLRSTMTAYIEQQCSVKEVAETLNLSVAAVKTRLFRARREVTRSAVPRGRGAKAGSAARSKRNHVTPDFQNREMTCPSFD